MGWGGWVWSTGSMVFATTFGVARFLKNVGVIVEYRASEIFIFEHVSFEEF